ncbi:hypothetical protein GC170_09660 [bacterium]|nr:hypothetical protein [bacterium]
MARKRPSRPASKTESEGELLRLVEYEITADTLPDRNVVRLPVKSREAIDRLHAMSSENPRQAIQELPQWIELHPDIPVFGNFLAACYTKLGEDRLAEEVMHENYRKHPQYLFARVNMAIMYIEKGDYAKVAEIFDNKFDLSLLYPNRRRFHISEFLCFMYAVGLYFVGVGNPESAKVILHGMQSVDPDDPKTVHLRKKLQSGRWKSLLRIFAAEGKLEREER